jgi:hypothetical protein
MGLIAVLASSVSVLLGGRRMFPALGVIALPMMLSCGAVRLSRVLMVLRSFVMFVFGHKYAP